MRSSLIFSALGAASLILVAAGAGAVAGAGGSGDVDHSFGSSGVVVTRYGEHGYLSGLVVQGDGKIVAGGGAGPPDRFTVVRYLADGTLDPNFGHEGIASTAVGGWSGAGQVALQPDGKIVVAGVSDNKFAVVRYGIDGSLDSTFGEGGAVTTSIGDTASAGAVALQPDGDIVVGGSASFHGAGADDFALARYTPNGTLDATFGNQGVVTTRFPGQFGSDSHLAAILINPNGKIVGVGETTKECSGCLSRVALARYDMQGSLDASFGDGGIVATGAKNQSFAAQTAVLNNGGDILVGGWRFFDGAYHLLVGSYKPTGGLDHSYGTAGFAQRPANLIQGLALVLQADGRVVVVGEGLNRQELPLYALARLTADGRLDPSFGRVGVVKTSIRGLPFAAALQSDGKIVVGGRGENSAGDRYFELARFLGGRNPLLRVRKQGTGVGRVVSFPAGISCAPHCRAGFLRGSNVRLVAHPRRGSVVEWAGACRANHLICTATMSAALRRVYAKFWRCVAPDVVGRPLRSAIKRVRHAHCTVGRVRRTSSNAHLRGRVVSERPKPGTRRRAGARIALVVGR